jgi:hypothetical protein
MSPESGPRARVRQQYAPLYPELTADVWLSARDIAAILVARASQARRQSLHRRTWDPRHFDIRGVAFDDSGGRDRRPPSECREGVESRGCRRMPRAGEVGSSPNKLCRRPRQVFFG